MNKYLKKLFWYPPAETRIPLSALLKVFLPGSGSFQKALCEYLNVKKCVLANSGRALLYQLLEVLKENASHSRNEVLVPGYSCYSVAAAIVKANLKIRAYDLDPKTLAPDLDSLKKNASNKTLAVLSQRLFGIPTPIEELHLVAQNVGAYHIEDAAQAFGGFLNGKALGTIGDFGLFSFGRGKPLPIGCGGALIFKDKTFPVSFKISKNGGGYAELSKILLTQVLALPMFYGIMEALPLGLGETKFDLKFNISTLPSQIDVLAEKSMSLLNEINLHRNQIAEYYAKAFNEKSTITCNKNDKAVYTRYPLMVDSKPVVKEIKRLGVRRMYPKAIIDENAIKPYLVDDQAPTPGSSEIARNLITLPTHKGISDKIAKVITQEVKKVYSC